MQKESSYKPKVFYGWWIVFAGLAGMSISVGFANHGLSAFIIPIADEFNVDIAVVATILVLGRIETAFIGPVEGYLVDRFGPRTMMFIGVPILGVGLLVVSITSSLPTFVASFLLGVVLGTSLGFSMPISTAVANWWREKRGRAFGLMWLGFSVGALLVWPINHVIEAYGWRWAFRVMAILTFVVGFPVSAVMRHRPEDYGMVPDGERSKENNGLSVPSENKAVNSIQEQEINFTVWEALKTPALWYFTMAISVRGAVTGAVAINLFPLVESLGGSSSQAAFLFVIHAIFSAPGRLFFSWAGDWFNKRYLMTVLLGLLGIAILTMSQATSITSLTLLYAPYALVWGGLSSLPQSFRADLFGREHYASIQGAIAPFRTGFTFAAPVFAAWMFDQTGSYQIPLMVFGIFAFIAMGMIFMARPPEKHAST
ncbi:MAG: Sugar phosphate permease [Chloroflexi bacterium]|nr:MAG: Sugar phosphate permease [Chloroflexota bacterium]